MLRLLAAPFLLSLLDLAVTLSFQPAVYWEGDRSAVVEGNPIARWAFMIHPLMIVPGFIAWYALVIPLIFKAPAWFGLRVQVFLVLGHLTMISGWLIRNSEKGAILSLVFWGLFLPLAWRLFSPVAAQWNSKERVRLA